MAATDLSNAVKGSARHCGAGELDLFQACTTAKKTELTRSRNLRLNSIWILSDQEVSERFLTSAQDVKEPGINDIS